MAAWIYAMMSVILVSLVSFVGVLTFALKVKRLKNILLLLVSFSAGGLFGGAFLHLLPETFEKVGFGLTVSLLVLGGMLIFFVIEKFIHWRHCHIPTSKEHKHPFVYMNLVGDGVHNFTDGVIIGATYLISIPLGIATTLAVIFHEIPQEIGDFGVLVYGGFSRKKALMFNFMIALTAILGTIITLIVGSSIEGIAIYLLPITAGGFIYIAGSDLIPELHKECAPGRSLLQLLAIILGIGVMAVLKFI